MNSFSTGSPRILCFFFEIKISPRVSLPYFKRSLLLVDLFLYEMCLSSLSFTFFFFCFSTFPLLFLTGSHPAIPYFYIEKEESINCTKFSLVGLFVEGRKGISVDVFCSFFKNDTASEDFHCFYISQHWEDKNDLDVLQSFFFRNYFLCLESDMLGQLESYTIFINSYKNCCKFCISV